MLRITSLTLAVLLLSVSTLGAVAPGPRTITTTDSVQLFVTVKGSGPPCLYIHGGPGSGSHWVEKFSGEMLERRFTMVYLDQRGTGRSTSPLNADYSMERMVTDFETVRQALGFENWLIMGHSFGGILMTGYALRCPEAIEGLLMINCTLNIEASDRESWIPHAREILGDTAREPITAHGSELSPLISDLVTRMKAKGLFWQMGCLSKESWETLNASYRGLAWNGDESKYILQDQEYWQDFGPASAGVTQPVLFFSGAQDWMAGPENYKYALFPNLLLWKSETSHLPFLDSPAELEEAIDSYREKYGF